MAQAAATADPVNAKKSSKMVLVIAVVAAMTVGVGATWFLVGGKNGESHDKPAAPKPMPVIFFPLQTFTVNLVPEFGDQYLQVEMTLKMTSQSELDALKMRMPEVRDRVLYLLSSKRASELTTVAGKGALAAGIRDRLNMLLDPDYKPLPSPLKRTAPAAQDHASPAGHDVMNEHPDAAAHPAMAQPNGQPQNVGPVHEVLFTSFIIQ